MPKVKRLGIQDSRETRVRSMIGAIQGALRIDRKQLAEMAGIPPTTLCKRLTTGSIGNMRLSELWRLEDVGRRNGVWPIPEEDEGEKQ